MPIHDRAEQWRPDRGQVRERRRGLRERRAKRDVRVARRAVVGVPQAPLGAHRRASPRVEVHLLAAGPPRVLCGDARKRVRERAHGQRVHLRVPRREKCLEAVHAAGQRALGERRAARRVRGGDASQRVNRHEARLAVQPGEELVELRQDGAVRGLREPLGVAARDALRRGGERVLGAAVVQRTQTTAERRAPSRLRRERFPLESRRLKIVLLLLLLLLLGVGLRRACAGGGALRTRERFPALREREPEEGRGGGVQGPPRSRARLHQTRRRTQAQELGGPAGHREARRFRFVGVSVFVIFVFGFRFRLRHVSDDRRFPPQVQHAAVHERAHDLHAAQTRRAAGFGVGARELSAPRLRELGRHQVRGGVQRRTQRARRRRVGGGGPRALRFQGSAPARIHQPPSQGHGERDVLPERQRVPGRRRGDHARGELLHRGERALFFFFFVAVFRLGFGMAPGDFALERRHRRLAQRRVERVALDVA